MISSWKRRAEGGFLLEIESELERLEEFLVDHSRQYHREGFVVGLSGGIDSTLTSALCVRALGRENVFGVILPERDSNPISRKFAEEHARSLGIEYVVESITPELEAFGTYEKRDRVIKDIYPDYDETHRIKITLPPNLLEKDSLNFFTLVISKEGKTVFKKRLRKNQLLSIEAATNTKQRIRMLHLYYHAERLNYAVCGTTNRTEMIQGFFVKYGDGGVDLEPLAHLYKSEIYQLSKHLKLHQGIIDRPPSPDTYNSEVTDEDFFFRMPFDILDRLLKEWENETPIEQAAALLSLEEDQVERAFRDFSNKRASTDHLRELPPNLLEE